MVYLISNFMKNQQSGITRQLTQREWECLRLLLDGVGTDKVAEKLGISVSTLHKHLASARKKLGVTRTAQALLKIQSQNESSGERNSVDVPSAERTGEHCATIHDFADATHMCTTFSEAWSALRSYSGRLGVNRIYFGIAQNHQGKQPKPYIFCAPQKQAIQITKVALRDAQHMMPPF